MYKRQDQDYLVSQIAPQETAAFLNQYFRPAEAPVSAQQLNVQLLTEGRGGVVEPEMSHMNGDGTVTEGVPEPSASAPEPDAPESVSAPAEPAA